MARAAVEYALAPEAVDALFVRGTVEIMGRVSIRGVRELAV
jgi:hypothetical protein